jgi:type I restriction enzyme, S subunit
VTLDIGKHKSLSRWERVPFRKAVCFQEGPGVRNWQFRTSGIKLVNVKNIVEGKLDLTNTGRYLDPAEVKSKYSHFLLREGDFVLSSSGVTWGKIAEVRKEHLPLCLNTSMIRLVPQDPSLLDKRFLRIFVESHFFRSQIIRLITGSAQPNFGPSHLEQLDLPLPPLPEQKRIAEILDRAEALRAKRLAALAQLDTLSQSIFLDLFGDPVSNEKGWSVHNLRELTDRITKGESPKWQGFDYQSDGALFVTSENVRLGSIDLTEPKFLPLEFHEKLERCHLRNGDILVNLVGASIGRSCIFPGFPKPSCVNQAVGVVTVREQRLDRTFLSGLLLSDRGQKLLLSNRVEGARANISLTDLRELPVILPPLPLQHEFARRAAAVEKLKVAHRQSLVELDALFASLQHRAFRGEL